MQACVLCSVMTCLPGFFSSGCSSTSDAICLPCANPPLGGPFTWGNACQFNCSQGFFRNGSVCVPCSEQACAPGTYVEECLADRDRVCVPCDAVPDGSFDWTDGCAFECRQGFFRDDRGCLPCTTSIMCPPGFRVEECGTAHDIECMPCELPEGDGYAWTNACDFTCKAGFFFEEGQCRECDAGECAPGSYAVNCTLYSDQRCLACAAVSGGVRWVAGCEFECHEGYYLDGGACVECSHVDCAAGTYARACSSAADAACIACAPLSTGIVWTDGCDFQCADGFYLSGGLCVACTQLAGCSPGMLVASCNGTADATCVACGRVIEGAYNWTDGCQFVCASEFYLAGPDTCVPCVANLTCDPGFQLRPCGGDRDSVCEPCSSSRNGTRYVDGCAFVCEAGYFALGSGCVPCVDPAEPGAFAWSDDGTCGFVCIRAGAKQDLPQEQRAGGRSHSR